MTPVLPLKIEDLASQHAIFTQSYNSPSIPGVTITQLPLFQDEKGTFAEVFRTSGLKFDIKQCSHSVIEPGAIKAFHLHYKQTDLWYIPHNTKLLVCLADLRTQTSPTPLIRKFLSGVLLTIPPGVAHGCANFTEKDSNLFYFTDQEFDIKNPDEHRLPVDQFDKVGHLGVGNTLWRKKDG